ncbi:MAG TPA: ATP-binding protein [Saprospiraceae bacterium]|nr:ATP-binding protein [Saprospiraceae bacterium]
MIPRILEASIKERLGSEKAILLFGARQLGKTTLLRTIFGTRADTLWLNCDEPDVQVLFQNVTSSRLKTLFAGYRFVVFDEAQRIPDIGLKLKLITDHIPQVQVIATGSSAFELANKAHEPLTGRKWEYQMFPVSFEEMVTYHGLLEEQRQLHSRLLYGYYPEIINNPGEERERLKTLTDSFLYKDILHWENIQKPDKLIRLMQALSFQVGRQVSYSELGNLVGLDNKTVEKYLNLLEQVFVIFRLGSFSRNLRNELKASRKIYFFDNGIRNALIAAFQPIDLRQDIGALWENWILSERMKYLHYHNIWTNTFFWRTSQQQEIDLVEERDGTLSAYEFKWASTKKSTFPRTFTENYKPVTQETISPDNFEKFVGIG